MEREQSKNFRSHYIGKEAEVLWEETKEIAGEEFLIGHTKDYVKIAVPMAEVESVTAVRKREFCTNSLKKVVVTNFLTDEILVAKDC